jgi:hypothetical protein
LSCPHVLSIAPRIEQQKAYFEYGSELLYHLLFHGLDFRLHSLIFGDFEDLISGVKSSISKHLAKLRFVDGYKGLITDCDPFGHQFFKAVFVPWRLKYENYFGL